MRYLLLLLGFPLLAVTTVQPVTEVTAQQAIIRLNTTSSSCTHAVTETAGGATPDDVNTSIFSGSNSDSRAGSVVNGQQRTFVFGQRTAAQGSDGLIHSRSAKALTGYQDVITCSPDSPITITFTTGNIQNGNVFLEQPPFCAAGFGNWCWPSIDWTNQSKVYADPETGAQIRRVDTPGWFGLQREPANFDFAIGGSGWTSAQNILNGASCAGNSSTCGETANNNPIFLAVKGQNYNYAGPGNGEASGYATQGVTYDDFEVMLTGKTSAGGGATISVCLSYFDSGATCNTTRQTIALTSSVATNGFPAPDVGYSAGANHWNVQFNFGEWGGTAPKQGDFGAAYGSNLSVTGTAVSLPTACSGNSWSCFNTKWNNSYIYIAGSGCTDGGTNVCQVNGHPTDPEHLTLKNASATLSNVAWNSLASGVVVTGPGTSTVDIGAQFSFAFSEMWELLAEGDQQICNPVPVSVGFQANGTTPISPPVSGNLCLIAPQQALSPANGTLFLLIPSTGEVRLLSPLFTPQGTDSGDAMGDQNAGQLAFPIAPWDGVCGTCFYASGNTNTSVMGVVQSSLFKAQYDVTQNWKAYSHPLWACGTCFAGGHATPGQDPSISFPGGRWSDDPIIYTNISKPSSSLSLQAQIAANNPTWVNTIWPASDVGISRVVNGNVLVVIGSAGGYPESLNIFNLSTGAITAWGDTLNSFPIGWCGVHTVFTSAVPPGYFGIACNYVAAANSGVILGGRFQSNPYYVYSSGVPNTNTAITSSAPLETCSTYSASIPSKIMSLITAQGGQNSCMRIRTQNVVSKTPSTQELAIPAWVSPQNSMWSEPRHLAPGDEVMVQQTGTAAENDLVAAVTTGVSDAQCTILGGDCDEIILVRGIPSGNGPLAEANGWEMDAGPTLGGCGQAMASLSNCTPGVGAWIPANAIGPISSSAFSDYLAFSAHSDAGTGISAGNMTYVLAGDPSYQLRYNSLPTSQFGSFSGATQITVNPSFNGVTTGGCSFQDYPSNEQYLAPSQERRWFSDYHALNPSQGTSGENFTGSICNTTYSLVGGFSTVYKITSPVGSATVNENNYKSLGLQGWAGHNLLQDVSGPSSSLSDSIAYQICRALAVNECVTGSSAGDTYAAVPGVPSILTQCITSWVVEGYPCVGNLPSIGGWLVQHDASVAYSNFESARKITMGLAGYGRQYAFSTFIPESTGTWGMFKSDWTDGLRSSIFMAKLPPFVPASVLTNSLVSFSVPVPGGSMYAEAKFGYLENGAAGSYYCTSRQDTCTTSSTGGQPFVYPSIDSRTLQSCSSGCTVKIPVIAGRIFYYSIGTSPDGTTWTYGSQQVARGLLIPPPSSFSASSR